MRQKKNKIPQFKKVESVKIHKLSDRQSINKLCPEGFVYDLSLEKNHNYFANGINVHNCGAFPKPSNRAKTIKKLFFGKDMILMSGTPSPESYSQLYHQFYISPYSPWNAYSNFYKWAKLYVNIKQKYLYGKTINDYSTARKDLVMRDVLPFIVKMSQEDAGFTAFVKEEFRYIPMTLHQQDIYKEMDKEGIVSQYETIATNAADRINKLSQICGGTLITDNKELKFISQAKAYYILQNFPNKKIAIFYKYKGELEILKMFFPVTDSPELFNAADNLVFAGQFQSIREGVDLRTADALVMYNIDFSATTYWQSRARLQNKERTKEAVIYWIFTENGIEDYVYEAVSKKKNFTSTYYRKLCKQKKTTQKKSYNVNLNSALKILDLL